MANEEKQISEVFTLSGFGTSTYLHLDWSDNCLGWLTIKISTMNKNGEIIIFEDDEDDKFMLGEAFRVPNYPNKVFYFPDGLAALDYLHKK